MRLIVTLGLASDAGRNGHYQPAIQDFLVQRFLATDTIIAFTAVAVNTIVPPTTTTAISVPTRSILIPLHTSACVVGNKQ